MKGGPRGVRTALKEKAQVRDRTGDRHKTKDQSRIGEDRIQEAFEYAASGVAITDLERRFKQTNSAYRAIVSRNDRELDGETILSLTHEADQARCKEQLDQLVSGQIPCFVLEKRNELRLRVRPATDWRTATPGVRVTVSDTGSGITPETRKRIYDPFFTTKGNQGTSQILAKHSGSMHLRGVKTGKSGTAFTLIFPKNGAEGKTAGLGDLS